MPLHSMYQQSRLKIQPKKIKVLSTLVGFFSQLKKNLLKIATNQKFLQQNIIQWKEIGLILGVLFLVVFSREVAKIFTLQSSLFANTPKVYVEEQNDKKTQVVVKKGMNTNRISNESYTNTGLVSNDGYAVWMADIDGLWQIFVYDKTSKETFQLTAFDNNISPKLYDHNIAWKSQIDGIWQVMMFDGINIQQVTKTTKSIEEFVFTDKVVAYSHLDERNKYMDVFVHELLSNKVTQINGEDSGHALEVVDGNIQWKDQGGDIHVYEPPIDTFWGKLF